VLGMAFDEGLAERVRHLHGAEPGLSERKMFGGLCFLVNGNMAFGIVGSELMVRVGQDAYIEALSLPEAREMDSPDIPCWDGLRRGAWCVRGRRSDRVAAPGLGFCRSVAGEVESFGTRSPARGAVLRHM
jgi:hypothetical protein